MTDLVTRLRDYADNPNVSGYVPVSPETLREAADKIDELMAELFDALNSEGDCRR